MPKVVFREERLVVDAVPMNPLVYVRPVPEIEVAEALVIHALVE